MENSVNIQYSGIRNQPSEFGCTDGELAEAVNLISENGELKAIVPPRIKASEKKDFILVHRTSNNVMNIYKDNFGIYSNPESGGNSEIGESDFAVSFDKTISATGKYNLCFSEARGRVYIAVDGTTEILNSGDYNIYIYITNKYIYTIPAHTAVIFVISGESFTFTSQTEAEYLALFSNNGIESLPYHFQCRSNILQAGFRTFTDPVTVSSYLPLTHPMYNAVTSSVTVLSGASNPGINVMKGVYEVYFHLIIEGSIGNWTIVGGSEETVLSGSDIYIKIKHTSLTTWDYTYEYITQSAFETYLSTPIQRNVYDKKYVLETLTTGMIPADLFTNTAMLPYESFPDYTTINEDITITAIGPYDTAKLLVGGKYYILNNDSVSHTVTATNSSYTLLSGRGLIATCTSVENDTFAFEEVSSDTIARIVSGGTNPAPTQEVYSFRRDYAVVGNSINCKIGVLANTQTAIEYLAEFNDFIYTAINISENYSAIYQNVAGETVRFLINGEYISVENNKFIKITYSDGIYSYAIVDGFMLDSTYTEIYSKNSSGNVYVSAIGNILIISTDSTLNYFLYKNNNYTYLGNSLPEIDIRFGLEAEIKTVSDNSQKYSDTFSNIGSVFDEVEKILTEYWNGSMSSYFRGNGISITNLRTYVLGLVDKFVNENAFYKKKFIYPFYVRAAWRLYDGSYFKHTPPILLIPSSGQNPAAFINYCNANSTASGANVTIGFSISAVIAQLFYELGNMGDLTAWKDIISGLEIFTSEQIYFHGTDYLTDEVGHQLYAWSNAAGNNNNESFAIFGNSNAKQNQKDLLKSDLEYNKDGAMVNGSYSGISLKFLLPVPKNNSDSINSLLNNPVQFYSISYTPLDSLSQTTYSQVNMSKISDTSNTSLVTQTQMISDSGGDDYDATTGIILSNKLFSYNERLILSGIRRNLFGAKNPILHLPYIHNLALNNLTSWQLFAIMNTSTGYKSAYIGTISYNNLVQYISTNDLSVEAFYLISNNSAVLMNMIKSSSINQKYYSSIKCTDSSLLYSNLTNLTAHGDMQLNDRLVSLSLPSVMSKTELQETIYEKYGIDTKYVGDTSYTPDLYYSSATYLNKLFCSLVENPFVFSDSGVITVGNGYIIGTTTTAIALSQGQFGQFPLIVFCSDGIWALTINDNGEFVAKQPISRLVCNNANSICQLDGGVAFSTDRGMFIIQGSTIEPISSKIYGQYFDKNNLPFLSNGTGSLPEIVTGYGTDEMISSVSDSVDFVSFIKTCSAAYNFAQNQLFLFREDKLYQYVYSRDSGEWAKQYYAITYKEIINDFPNVYIQALNNRVTNDAAGGVVYNLSRNFSDEEFDLKVNGLAVSRPLTFGDKNVLKTIKRIENRGYFDAENDSFVKIALYGSRDLHNWYKIRSLRGCSFKYFRIVYYTRLSYTEAFTGSSFVVDGRWTDKIR